MELLADSRESLNTNQTTNAQKNQDRKGMLLGGGTLNPKENTIQKTKMEIIGWMIFHPIPG